MGREAALILIDWLTSDSKGKAEFAAYFLEDLGPEDESVLPDLYAVWTDSTDEEYRHLAAHASLANEIGVPEVNILEDGDCVVLEDGELRVERGALPAGYVYVDGSGLGDMSDVLRDRRHLADDGVLIVSLGVEISSGDIVFGPDIDSHGVTDDSESLHEEIAKRVRVAVEAADTPLDFDDVRRQVRVEARRAVTAALERRPVVIPVLIEV